MIHYGETPFERMERERQTRNDVQFMLESFGVDDAYKVQDCDYDACMELIVGLTQSDAMVKFLRYMRS